MRKILIAIFVLLIAIPAWSKDINLTLEFDYDTEFEADTQMFRLYYQNIKQPGIFILVAEETDVSIRSWDVPTFDLAPGKTSDFFVAAVYDTGEEELSESFPFRFMGRPTIRSIIRHR